MYKYSEHNNELEVYIWGDENQFIEEKNTD